MEFEHSGNVPPPAIRIMVVKLPFSNNFCVGFGLWRRRSEDDVKKNIMKVARKVKEIDPDPTLVEAANTEGAAETDFAYHDVMEAFLRIPGGGDNSGVLEFQSILEKLQIDDLEEVERHLEILEGRLEIAKILEESDEEIFVESDDEPYPAMLVLNDIKAAAPTSGGNFAIKVAGPAIGAICAKVTFNDLNLEPFEKFSGAVGLISVMAGLVLQGKKPGLSRAMLKLGSLAIGLPMIWSMSKNLEGEIISWFFLAIATAIVGVTAFYA